MPRERGKTKIERIRHYLVGTADTRYLTYYYIFLIIMYQEHKSQ